MADALNVRVIHNGFRNAVVRASLVSDGSGLTGVKFIDATSVANPTNLGVLYKGQTLYPGTNLHVVGLDYDVQDMKVQLNWDATSPELFLALGSAPEDFNWKRFGGHPVPPGLVGATGNILISTVNQAPQSTFFLIIYLTKGIPAA